MADIYKKGERGIFACINCLRVCPNASRDAPMVMNDLIYNYIILYNYNGICKGHAAMDNAM